MNLFNCTDIGALLPLVLTGLLCFCPKNDKLSTITHKGPKTQIRLTDFSLIFHLLCVSTEEEIEHKAG